MKGNARNAKIQPHHLDRQAFVYIRQSSLQQVQNHQESTQLQYNLQHHARDLGWSQDRIQIIDEDLGKSAAGLADRQGFQRLVTEVTLDHVGLVLGIEMSRLARSSRDWHQLLEVCALFGTLIADQDGIYDPQNFNDRLLLGLKGTMSEAELHVIKQRMVQGRLNKALRGELRSHLPIGYYNLKGQVVIDPDEQVQHVVRLIFRKFRELGTLHALVKYLARNGIQIPVRLRGKDQQQELTWRKPNRMTLLCLLHHPMYAGAYSYGRRRTDQRKQKIGRPSTGRVVQDPSQWHAFIPDHFPAYITWEDYLHNQQQFRDNQMRSDEQGSPRNGKALLSGLLFCGMCGRRMSMRYTKGDLFAYACNRGVGDYGEKGCQSCAGPSIDRWVVNQVLEALKPASIEISLAALKHLEDEREALQKLWQQRLERAHYEAERCHRQYQQVEPENRLVARSLERAWEEKLAAEQKLEEEHHRFLLDHPKRLSETDIELIRTLSKDIPTLWFAGTTTDKERKTILRQIIEKITLWVSETTEHVNLEIQWVGRGVTSGVAIRPVAKLEQLSYYPDMVAFVKSQLRQGTSMAELPALLDQAGYRPAKRVEKWTLQSVRRLINRWKTTDQDRPPVKTPEDHWWALKDLASVLGMPVTTLHRWVTLKQVQAEKNGGRWLVWADPGEVEALRRVRATPVHEITHQKWLDRKTGSG